MFVPYFLPSMAPQLEFLGPNYYKQLLTVPAQVYNMFLDDGESRNSAPTDSLANHARVDKLTRAELDAIKPYQRDCEAADQYRQVQITQEWICFLSSPTSYLASSSPPFIGLYR